MKQFHLIMSSTLLVLCSLVSQAQQTVSTNTSAVVPPLVNFSGVLADETGKPLTGAVEVTFSLYSEQTGGSALWMETQNVQPDRTGHYTVMLGSTSNTGLPADIFVAGEAHWLGVQIEGEAEQPRALLVSAPYALKAGDAQTLGGLPASAFVLAAPGAGNVLSAGTEGAGTSSSSASLAPATAADVTTTGGTVGTIAAFSTSTNIQSSLLSQTGTTAINVGGKLNLPATGSATSNAGFNSRPMDFVASSFNSSTSAAVSQTFQWQAQPAGNDSSAPAASLNLLFGSGTTAPAQTGLNIASSGLITFASGQTFPGTGNGTITGVTTATGSGLNGGGTSGTLQLGLTTACASSQVLQWNGSAWACSSAGTGTITGVTAGTGLTGGGTSGGITLKVNTSTVPLLNAANTFVGNQAITGNITATGTIAGQTGAFTANSSNPVATVTQSGTGVGLVVNASRAVYGIQSTATLLGLYATATAAGGDGLSGNSTGGVGVYGYDNATSGTSVGVTGQSTSSTGFGVVGELDNTTTSGVVAGVLGTSSAQYSDSGPGFGIVGQSPTMGVYGASAGVSNNGQEIINGVNQVVAGVWGDTGANDDDSYVGVLGTADNNPAGAFENNSSDVAALTANNGSSTSGAPVFQTVGAGGTGICTIDVHANLTCSGKIGGAVDAEGGARKVSVYAVQSPENWLEDFGSGTLSNGAARVVLDPTFASTVNTSTDYHVFLTPKGDCKGLYVANETATGFEVLELGGGHSGVRFDYRIVAKRNGFESVRLADVTERYRKMDQKRQLRHEQMTQRRAARSAAGPTAAAAIPAHR